MSHVLTSQHRAHALAYYLVYGGVHYLAPHKPNHML
jgi:hypothetical protein